MDNPTKRQSRPVIESDSDEYFGGLEEAISLSQGADHWERLRSEIDQKIENTPCTYVRKSVPTDGDCYCHIVSSVVDGETPRTVRTKLMDELSKTAFGIPLEVSIYLPTKSISEALLKLNSNRLFRHFLELNSTFKSCS
jgi:hypothetical protein